MWYTLIHASPPFGPSTDGHRTRYVDGGIALSRCLHHPPLPNPVRFRTAGTCPRDACALGCNAQTVRNAIHAFNRSGLDALTEGSSRPHRITAAFDAAAAERLRALLHQSPRRFDKPTSVWTLDLAAAVCCTEGITDEQVTGETIRVTLRRLGVRWRRAKQWITSPDPAYARKKSDATG